MLLHGSKISMQATFHKKFKKQLKKLPPSIQKKFFERMGVLIASPHDPLLNVHRLTGDMDMFLSMNVTGDYRAYFTYEDYTIEFYKIGTHSELY